MPEGFGETWLLGVAVTEPEKVDKLVAAVEGGADVTAARIAVGLKVDVLQYADVAARIKEAERVAMAKMAEALCSGDGETDP